MTSTLLHLVNPDVDGAAVLEDLKEWLGRFIAVVEPQDLDVLALWSVHKLHLLSPNTSTPAPACGWIRSCRPAAKRRSSTTSTGCATGRCRPPHYPRLRCCRAGCWPTARARF